MTMRSSNYGNGTEARVQVEKRGSAISGLEEVVVAAIALLWCDAASDVVTWFLQLRGGAWRRRNEHDGRGNEHRRNQRPERR